MDVLNEIAKAAVIAEKATGCPAELIAGQCILESGWLKSAPGNNCFGIKSYLGEFGRQLLHTTEWFTVVEAARFLALGDGRTAVAKHPDAPARHDGRWEYAVVDWFATFQSLGDCFARRARIFTVGRYKDWADAYAINENLEALIRGIAPIYATDPNYADSVLKIVGQSNVKAALARERAA